MDLVRLCLHQGKKFHIFSKNKKLASYLTMSHNLTKECSTCAKYGNAHIALLFSLFYYSLAEMQNPILRIPKCKHSHRSYRQMYLPMGVYGSSKVCKPSLSIAWRCSCFWFTLITIWWLMMGKSTIATRRQYLNHQLRNVGIFEKRPFFQV